MTRGAPGMRVAAVLALGVVTAVAACGNPSTEFRSRAGDAELVPAGSVPRGTAALHVLARAPGPTVTPALLARGERGYAAQCAACHGTAGRGDGPVVRLGFPPPPPLERGAHSAEHVVRVITHGHGDMPAMARIVAPVERWAIARWLESR